MVDIFAAVASALGALLGTSGEIAGYILGFIVTIVTLIALMWALGGNERMGGDSGVFMIAGAIGIVFSVLVGWFPVWVIVFMALIIALVIIKPFGSGGSPV